jgi:SAM-dependent methyltransferase
MSNDTSYFYRKFWENKKDVTSIGPTSRHVRENIISLLQNIHFDKVLDLGCGEGSLLAEMKIRWPDKAYYGADLSEEALELAAEKIDFASYHINLEKDFIDVNVDVTICSEVLEHIKDDVSLLGRIRGITNYLVITVPSGKMDAIDSEVGHVRRYAKGEIEEKLHKAGFEVQIIRNWGFPFYSPFYRMIFKETSKDLRGGKVTFLKKCVASFVYLIFKLNVCDKGDKTFLLAKKV